MKVVVTTEVNKMCKIPAKMSPRDAPITHRPIIGRPIIGAKQSADYRLIQKVSETGQKPAVHTV